jgi:SAM-dependent methyltransferase
MTTTTSTPVDVEAVVGRLLTAGVGAIELCNIYLGSTLGLYRHLAAAPATSAELAARAGVDERYVREWLQGQATSGFVAVDGPDVTTATFTLPAGMDAVLLDELSPAYLTPLAALLISVGRVMPELVDAFRSGDGVPYAAYPEAVAAQAALNRPAYHGALVSQWLPAMPDVAARLAAGARVADLGCGVGWAAIALAQAYPDIRVDGYDADEESIAIARRNAAAHGVDDRVRFEVCDLSAPDPDTAGYDVVLMFECLHDMAYPDRVLASTRAQLADGGTLLVMDEATDDELVAPTEDPIQRLFAGISPLWCLPQGRTAPDAHPVGTVLRTSRLRELATSAGFTTVNVLPIAHPLFRFYRLENAQ